MKTRITPLVSNCVAALKKEDFHAYIRHLDELGQALYYLYSQQHPDAQPHSNKIDRQVMRRWLLDKIEKETWPPCTLTPDGALAYCAFEEAWLDEHLKKPMTIAGKPLSRRYLSPKSHLNQSTRHYVRLGMLCIAKRVAPQTTTIANRIQIAHLDKAAYTAIRNYQTRKHRALGITGKILAFAISLASSLTIMAAVGLFIASPFGMAFGIVAASITFVAVFAFYWISTSKLIPRLLIDLFGKDHLLEGWTHYRDEETGKKKTLSLTRKCLLGLSALLSAVLSVGIGIMTYSLTAYFAQWPLFTFLMVGTATCGFPPLGIIAAVIIGLGSFSYFTQSLVGMLHAKNIRTALKKPFLDALWVFDPQNTELNAHKSTFRLNAERALAFTIVGVLSALTFIGLIILQINYAKSLALWMETLWAVSSTIAIGIADTIATSAVLIGQLPYVFRSLTGYVLYCFPSNHKKDDSSAHQPTPTDPVASPVHLLPQVHLPTPHLRAEAQEARIRQITTLPPPASAGASPSPTRYRWLFTHPAPQGQPPAAAPSSPRP